MFLFRQPNHTPVIGLPIANHDDNQHAADEISASRTCGTVSKSTPHSLPVCAKRPLDQLCPIGTVLEEATGRSLNLLLQIFSASSSVVTL
jgi:hypothetical protein